MVRTRIPALQPGQPCAYWRWAWKGLKKRGSWTIARFLAWDPTSPTKLAWLRTGNATTLVTTEQLRAAVGFEECPPSEQDIRLLKDASQSFTKQMLTDGRLEDETGQGPPEEATHEDYQPALETSLPPTNREHDGASKATRTDFACSRNTVTADTLQNIHDESANVNVQVSPVHTPAHRTPVHSYGKLPRERTPRRARRAQLTPAPIYTTTSTPD